MALVALHQLLLDERGAGVGHHVFPIAPPRLVEQRLIAPQPAALEQRGAHRRVVLGLAHAFLGRTGRVPDLQAQVPQHVEHPLHHVLVVGGLLVGQQEQQIDIGMGREFAAPVPAHRRHGEALARGAHAVAEHPLGRKLEQRMNQPVDEKRLGAHHLGTGGVLGFEAPPDLLRPFLERCLERVEDFRSRLTRLAVRRGPDLLQPRHQAVRTDDMFRIRNGGQHFGRDARAAEPLMIRVPIAVVRLARRHRLRIHHAPSLGPENRPPDSLIYKCSQRKARGRGGGDKVRALPGPARGLAPSTP